MCPYTEHAPTTIEGWQAWRAAELAGFPLRRLADGRPIGFDLATVLTVATAAGFDTRALAELLPAIGAGLMMALANRTDDDG